MHISLKNEIKRSGIGKVGIGLLLFVIAMALLAPLLSGYNPMTD
jgi:hypothetical protein